MFTWLDFYLKIPVKQWFGVSMAYILNWENRGLEIRLSGMVTPAQVRRYEADVYGDPYFDELTYIIWNGAGIDDMMVDEDLMKESAAYSVGSTRTKPVLNLAMVTCRAASPELMRTFVEINKALKSTWRISVFEDVADARQWAEQHPELQS